MASTQCAKRLPLVVILGCTGTGKSKLAIEIGKRLGGEIISADSMQVYKGLPIITNQVTKEEMEACPHHVINFVSPLKEYSVVQFRNMALPLIEDIKKRGKIPIVVGGTNYYIESLLWNILIENFDDDDNHDDDDDGSDQSAIKKRKVIQEEESNDNDGENQTLHQKLQEVDPDMAARLHPNDIRKIARSLQVFEQHGVQHSELIANQQAEEGGSGFGGPLRFDSTCVFWLQCEKEVLNQRLDKRVDDMIGKGLVKELLDFHSAYNKERINNTSRKYTEGIFQSIGFKEFHNFLISKTNDETTFEIQDSETEIFSQCVDAMKTVTRRYAKKQTQWVKNRFLGRPEGSSPHLYGLDATDLTNWQTDVLQVALDILDSIINNRTLDVNPLPRNVKDPNEAHSRHVCKVCDNRVIIGDKAWAKHIVSKSHKWHLKKARTLEK